MRPKRLEFCGINSFSRKAEIDFDKLLSGGIFGIFGDTGSGKTTILDSMIFALYGRADRVKDGTAGDLINYNCDRAYTNFEFETSTQEGRRVFRIERELRRKNSAQTLRLYERTDGRLIALSEGVKNTNAMIEEIVGLSFEEFKKCIALPQGEFARFLKETKSERLKLISHLFGLDKYGNKLSDRLKERYAQVRSAHDLKAGELSGYGEVAEGGAAKLREELAGLRARGAALDEEFVRFRAEYEKLGSARKRYLDFCTQSAALAALQTDEPRMTERRKRLKLLPAAREILSVSRRIEDREKKIQAVRNSLAAAKDEGAKAAAEEEALKLKYDPEKGAEELAALTAKLSLAASLRADADALSQDRAEYAKQRSVYADAQKKRADAQKLLERCEAKEKELAAEAENFSDASLDELLRHDLDSALLTSEYRQMRGWFFEKREELCRDFRDGELYRRVDAELSSQLSRYDGLLSARKTGDAEKLLDAYKSAQQAKNVWHAACNKAVLEKSRAAAALAEWEALMSRAAEAGAQAKERAERAEQKLRAALGEGTKDLAAYEKDLLRQKSASEEVRERYAAASKRTEERKRCAESAVLKAETALAQYLQDDAEDRRVLQERIAASPFENVREAGALLEAFPDEQSAEKELADFEGKLLAAKTRLASLTEEGIPPAVSEEELAARRQETEQLEKSRQTVAESAAVYESRIADLERREEKKKQLQKELRQTEQELELVEKLRELLRGNGLMEYVAGEYLADISAAATKTLLKLTGGRYFIRYDQGFMVGDNLCGGELRSVNTLSGGETFLVSLALALALSAAIYAKSLKPIEFFFLDEGFGTLDEKLIDTVMDSLEKLRDSHFSVGLISHVDELRHRIANKILVRGAAENGSSEIQFSF